MRSCRLNYMLAYTLALVVTTLPGHVLAEDTGVPGLLRFAQQYDDATPLSNDRHEKKKNLPYTSGRRPVANTGLNSSKYSSLTPATERVRMQQQLAESEVDRRQLEAKLQVLPAPALQDSIVRETVLFQTFDPHAVGVAVGHWLAGVRAALLPTPTELQLSQALAKIKERVTVLQENLIASEQALKESEILLAGQAQKLAQNTAQIRQLQHTSLPPVAAGALDDIAGQQAYVLGTLLGDDIREAEQMQQALGMPTERALVLAGVMDSLQARYRLDGKHRQAALAKLAAVLAQKNRQTRAQGEAYLSTFRQDPAVKQSIGGFWYRIDYAGYDPLPANSVVSVVVREALSDGKVVQDMDIAGTALIQPLSDFPALFREAIGLVGNHGSLTMVVPPELAYGVAGFPPSIPPEATMVYTLRVTQVENEVTSEKPL